MRPFRFCRPAVRCRLVWLLAMLLAVSACTEPSPPPCQDPLGCVDLLPGEPLRLGVIQALSGKVATLGQEQVRGLKLALDRRGGTLLGHDVELRLEDTGCTPEGGANAALRIVADRQIPAIFGTTCSAAAAAAAEVMSGAGLVMVSGNNSASYLTAARGRKGSRWQAGFLRTAPNEELAGPAGAHHAFKQLGIRRVALINDGDMYTTDLCEGFREAFHALGGQVVFESTISRNDVNMEPVLTALRNAQAEMLFFPLFQPDGNRLLQAARRTAGLERMVFMSSGSLIDASFLQDVGADALGMYFVGPAPPAPGPQLDRLAAEYVNMFGCPAPTMYYVNAFDGAMILLDALEQAAQPEEDGGLRIGRQRLRDALYATRNVPGVYGTITCDAFGDCAAGRFTVLRCDDLAAGIEGLKRNVVSVYPPEVP